MTPAATPAVNLDFKFVNDIQELYYYCNKRNQNFNGGFGNGKSFGASMKALTLLTTFPKYRIGISRYSGKELSESTMKTFFKICPPELYADAYGGRRDDRGGSLRLINGSEVVWMHLDDYAEADLRGKEFNSVLTDQLEEIAESIYITLDSRMERWDQAQIPPHLNPEHFPKNKFTGKPEPPCYNMSLFNPESTLHWIYKRFHPESSQVEDFCGKYERTDSVGENSGAHYYKDAAWFTASMHDNPAISESLKRAHRSREQAWVDRFYWGKWGIAGGAIHYIPEASILDFAKPETRDSLRRLLEVIQKDGIKYRVMDHGEAAPTCCLWFAWLSASVLFRNYGIKSKGIHICYREYYQPGKIIKVHRENIAHLSGDERYYGNFADPQIFKKTSQKYGGFWSPSDDYLDTNPHLFTPEEIKKAPPIAWSPADNNEYSCRDAINELLTLDENIVNPISGDQTAPGLYFLKRHTVEYPQGANYVISQTASARRKKIGSENGEDIYSDERADGNDHSYDPLRYYAIMPKTHDLPDKPREIPQFSFNKHLQRRKIQRYKNGRMYGR